MGDNATLGGARAWGTARGRRGAAGDGRGRVERARKWDVRTDTRRRGARWTPRRGGRAEVARRVATDDVGAETAAARITGAVGDIAAIAAVLYAGDEVGTARA